MDNFYLETIRAFNDSSVAYMVVGGFAVNFHGYNRTTGDLDLWISNEEENLKALERAVDRLGFELPKKAVSELRSGGMITFSNDECVVELMTRLNLSMRTSFAEVFERAEVRVMNDLKVRVISLSDLKEEKSKSKRYKDLDDLSKLEEAEAYYKERSEKE